MTTHAVVTRAAQVATQVVDGLADHGFAVVDGAVSSAVAARYRRNLTRLRLEGAFRPAAIERPDGRRVHEGVRSDDVFWLSEPHLAITFPAFRRLADAIEAAVNRELYLGVRSREFHGAVYDQGAFYRRHLDQKRGAHDRLVTLILYLNPKWRPTDGGQLVVYDDSFPGGQLRLDPKAGRLVAFLSHRFPHEVIAANRSRFTITGWLRRDPS